MSRWTPVFVVLWSALVVAQPAGAATYGDHFDFSSTEASVEEGRPSVVVVVGRDGSSVGSWSSGRDSGSSWRCSHHDVHAVGDYHFDVDFDHVAELEEGGHYALLCYDADDSLVWGDFVTFDPADPLGGIAAQARAVEEAVAALDLPAPGARFSPGSEMAHLVGLDTWLWVDGPWEAQDATATVGGVSATVVATPVLLRWDPGDGSDELRCDGPGVAYAVDVAAERACTHRWHHRSGDAAARGVFVSTVSVDWDVAWSDSTGDGGALEAVTTTVTHDLRVVEVQAVIDY